MSAGRSTPLAGAGARGPRGWLHRLGVAVQFLTRLPVRVRYAPGDLRCATGAFPVVGALVAAIGIGARWALAPWLGDELATIVALAVMVVTTGALHEDGLADTVDGLWGGDTPEERLRIMRDSRLGTFGTLTLIVLFALKFAALAPMSLGAFAAALVPAMVLARASSLVLMRVVPPAPDSLASLAGPPSAAGWVVAGVSVALSLAGFGARAWLPLVLVALAIPAAASIARRKVGGINGDQLGAANQLVEVAVLLAGVVAFEG